MKTRILLFTEEAHVAKAVARIAQKSEREGAATDTIRRATAFLRNREWDVVIADIGRHGHGFEIFNALDNGDDGIPIVVLTELGDELSQALAMANGASEVLTKAVNPEQLCEVVTQLSQRGFRA